MSVAVFTETRKNKLAKLIKILEEEIGFKFDISKFENRLKLQKYVYLARFFNLDLRYNFNMYINGPYSPDLARDYFELGVNYNYEQIEPDYDSEFRKDDYIALIKGKNKKWLELASTILMIKEKNKDLNEDEIIELTIYVKPFARVDELKKIIKTLKYFKLI